VIESPTKNATVENGRIMSMEECFVCSARLPASQREKQRHINACLDNAPVSCDVFAHFFLWPWHLPHSDKHIVSPFSVNNITRTPIIHSTRHFIVHKHIIHTTPRFFRSITCRVSPASHDTRLF
jgi:hypothetical protein